MVMVLGSPRGSMPLTVQILVAADTSSVFFMKQFYAHVPAHDSPAEALATAKKEMFQTFGKAAVPYYWAAYTFERVPGR